MCKMELFGLAAHFGFIGEIIVDLGIADDQLASTSRSRKRVDIISCGFPRGIS